MTSKPPLSNRTLLGVAIAGGLIIAVSGIWNIGPVDIKAEDELKPDVSLSAFMRKKLDASSQILEGLTTEDADLIKKGAKTFLELSKVEKWNILTDETYREISSEFRANSRKLLDAAEKENFDNATLQWIDATKNCIECHKHVRKERAGAKPK